jgi:hypothetical protein
MSWNRHLPPPLFAFAQIHRIHITMHTTMVIILLLQEEWELHVWEER